MSDVLAALGAGFLAVLAAVLYVAVCAALTAGFVYLVLVCLKAFGVDTGIV